MLWRDRVVKSGMVRASVVLAHPDNFRMHTLAQKKLVSQSIEEIGWVRRLLVNRPTGLLVDGHLRLALALEKSGGEDVELPVDYVELTKAEQDAILLILDESASMVFIDEEQRQKVLAVLKSSKGVSRDVVDALLDASDRRDQLFTPLVSDATAVDRTCDGHCAL